jgi:hypothetical protein
MFALSACCWLCTDFVVLLGYYHELFLRGKPDLACFIQRIKRKGMGPRRPGKRGALVSYLFAREFVWLAILG